MTIVMRTPSMTATWKEKRIEKLTRILTAKRSSDLSTMQRLTKTAN